MDELSEFCQDYSWEEVLQIIQELRSDYRYYRHFMFGNQYKPVDFSISDDF